MQDATQRAAELLLHIADACWTHTVVITMCNRDRSSVLIQVQMQYETDLAETCRQHNVGLLAPLPPSGPNAVRD